MGADRKVEGMTTTHDMKNMSEDELIKQADAGLRGQGAALEMKRRIGEESTKAAKRAERQSRWAIVIALAALLLSLTGLTCRDIVALW